MATTAIVTEDSLEVKHVDHDQSEAKIVDIEDREEYYVKPLYTYYCHCGNVSAGLQFVVYS